MKRYISPFACAVFAAAVSFNVSASTLVYEGFSSNDYTGISTTGTASNHPNASTLTDAIGFTDGVKWAGNNTSKIKIYAAKYGLSLPTLMTENGFTATGGAIGCSSSDTSAQIKGTYHVFASPSPMAVTGGKLYIRALMSVATKAAGQLKATTNPSTNADGCYYAFGVLQKPASVNQYYLFSNANCPSALGFGFWKDSNDSSQLKLSLLLTSADGATTVNYPLVTSAEEGTTYICYAEVTVNTDGAESIRANAMPISDYAMPVTWATLDGDSDTISLEWLTESVCPTAMGVAGPYGSAGGDFLADELRVGTEITDVLYANVEGTPTLSGAALSGSAGSYTVGATVGDAAATDAGALVIDGEGNLVKFSAGAVEQDANFSKTIDLSQLESDTTYGVYAYAENEAAAVTNEVGSIYNGSLSLAFSKNGEEYKCVPAEVTVSRAAADDIPLVVNYAFSSETGVEGRSWVAPSGSVTIPKGEASATIQVVPLIDMTVEEDIKVAVTVTAGNYTAPSAAVEVTIANFSIPVGWNCWVAAEDGSAATAGNWSEGRAPISTDKVLFDGDISSASCEWNSAADGGPSATVAEFKMTDTYTGTVTIDTLYSGTFSGLAVTGDMTVEGGTLTHPANSDAETYRLNLAVGGAFTLGAAAKIDLCGKGFAKGKYRSGSAVACHASSPQGNYSYVYGNVYEPEALGSGGNSNSSAASCGGGAVKLIVTGAATIEGTIDARSSTQKTNGNNPQMGVGAGGSIWLSASSVTGSGTLTANAWTADNTETSYQEAGSGGRIAVYATSGTVAIPYANLKANGGFGGKGAGAGTVFVKNAADANGTLLVGTTKGAEWSFAVRYPAKGAVTIVPPGETWNFDAVKLRDYGILGVPEGATLKLPNGFASIANTVSSTTPGCGLLYLGGTIDATQVNGLHTLAGSWIFQADSEFTFSGDVKCDSYAGFGGLMLLQPDPTNIVRNIVKVNGDLTVTSTAFMSTVGRGARNTTSGTAYGVHGGTVDAAIAGDNLGYDSIFHPAYSGNCGQSGDAASTAAGSGALKLSVSGTLQLDGKLNLSAGTGDKHRPGAGSLDLECGYLAGSGSISASGQAMSSGSNRAGAGGRVAVKLTGDGATISDVWKANISALGALNSTSNSYSSSAGTVYLQNAAEADGAGTILVRNTGSTAITTPTVLPSQKWGNESAAELKSAKLELDGAAIVRLAENLKFARLTLPSDCALDLHGQTLTVREAYLSGVKLAAGTYAVETSGTHSTYSALVNTSTDQAGALIVKPTGLVIVFH